MTREVYEFQCNCGAEIVIENREKCPRCGVIAVVTGWEKLKYTGQSSGQLGGLQRYRAP